jgi:hypothetical protein
MRALGLIIVLNFCASSLFARDLYVDPLTGDDKRDGTSATVVGETGPVKTIARGVKLAQPGDTVHLAKHDQPYHESVVFHNRHGEPGRPITVDGHGATIDGCEPLVVADWQEVAPGRYRKAKLLRTDEAVIGRYFMRFAGKMQHMGRSSKGTSAPLKTPDQLQPGEWTWVAAEDAFYVQIAPGQSLAEARIETPIRSSGVAISGDCSQLVIRNLRCTHVYNDGFNIHGKTRDVRFEQVAAIECGDDGVSAHGDCRIVVDGLESIGNSTGMCHTNESHTDCRRVVIRDCLGFDYFMIGGGRHRLSDSVLHCRSEGAVRLLGDSMTGAPCVVEFENVAIQRLGGRKELVFGAGAEVTVKRLKLDGFGLSLSGNSCSLFDSVLGGGTAIEVTVYPQVKWQADRNIYDVRFLRFDKQFIGRDEFATYQRERQQDTMSRWEKVEFAEPFTGERK